MERRSSAGVSSRRLSIIDLSDRAAQPMRSADGRYSFHSMARSTIDRPLRAELEANGYFFKTTSDTEVLLNLFMRDGAKDAWPSEGYVCVRDLGRRATESYFLRAIRMASNRSTSVTTAPHFGSARK